MCKLLSDTSLIHFYILIFLKFPHLSVPGLSCGMWDFLGGAWAFPVGDVGFSSCGMPAPERAGLVVMHSIWDLTSLTKD